MTEKDKFIIDLDKEISKAKTCNNNLLLVLIKEKQQSEKSFIEDIGKEKISIIRKTSSTKEVEYHEDGYNYLAVMIPEADKFAQSFIEKKIESTIQNSGEETNSPKYDILYSTIIFPDSGENSLELMEAAKNALKCRVEA